MSLEEVEVNKFYVLRKSLIPIITLLTIPYNNNNNRNCIIMSSLNVEIAEFNETYEKFHAIYEECSSLIQKGIESETTNENMVSAATHT